MTIGIRETWKGNILFAGGIYSAFTYYEDNFESDFEEYPTIEVKGVTKHYGDMYEDWEELETESVDKLVNSYLCLDEQVCINYELIRYWIDQEALNT